MTAEYFNEKMQERLKGVNHVFANALRRSRDMRKIMLDPLDVLRCLLDEPEIQDALQLTGIEKETVLDGIAKVEQDVPQGLSALCLLNTVGLLEGFKKQQYWSSVLMDSVTLGIALADSEGSFSVTSRHILAGIIRQGANTGTIVLKSLDLSGSQLDILIRVPPNQG